MNQQEQAAYDEALKRIEECRRKGEGGTSIDLKSLALTALPPQIGELTALTELVLAGNKLTTLPKEIGQLKALKGFSLYDNQITMLPPEFIHLNAVTKFSIAGNKLTKVPKEVFLLNELTELFLSENKLQLLPHEIGELSKLTSLRLNNNQLTTLPISLGGLLELQQLYVADNPLAAEFLKLGEDAGTRLISYLHTRFRAVRTSSQAWKRFDEAKLLFVGPGDVGKSWLLSALQGKKPTENKSTVGIEIARVPMIVPHPAEAGRNLQMNCWDFGGQDYYQITHQIFFSARAIYLLVWKPRMGVDPDLISRLDRIKLSASDTAKVLIVSTHADGGVPAVIGKDALKERFGDLIWGFYETDSAIGLKGTGIAALKQEIARAAAQLTGIDEVFSVSWHEAQNAIRGRRKVTMPFEDFATVCASHGMDRGQATDLANIMEVQGHAVFFADASEEGQSGIAAAENLVVLDPEWLAKAVGFVIKDNVTIAASGVLKHRRLSQIWRRNEKNGCPGYRKNLHGYLLWLMWKFDIAYKQSANLSLVPEMIARNRPDDLRWTPTVLGPESEATLICRIPQEPPLGIIPALTAAVHPLRRIQQPEENRDSLDRNWREGFFLDTLLRGTAFVELQDRDLRIVVRDKYPSDLTKRIADTLGEIRKQRWPNLELDMRVPCAEKKDRKPCKGTFRKSVIDQRRDQKVLCEECNKYVLASKMLDGFDLREEEVMGLLQSIDLRQHALQAVQRELMAASYRFFQQTIDPARGELLRAPCLFSILPEEGKNWQFLSSLTEHKARVTCWCEHPDGPHPGAVIGSGEPPDYILTNPKNWLVKIAPYISWAAVLLKAFVPLAGTVVEQAVGTDLPVSLNADITLMNDAAKALPSGNLEVGDPRMFDPGLRIRPEIVALRHLHDALLSQIPEQQRWGDLRPVATKSGEILWLCSKHAAIQQPPPQVI